MLSLALQALALSVVEVLAHSWCLNTIAQATIRLFVYNTEGLQGKTKTSYFGKLQMLNGLDPFSASTTAGTGNDSPSTCDLPLL